MLNPISKAGIHREAVADREPSVDTSFDGFFETYYKNRWSTNDILSFLRSFLTTTCYFRLSPGNRCLARKHAARSEEHTSELQSRSDLVCRLLLEKNKRIEFPNVG